jgi:hypothetical protein
MSQPFLKKYCKICEKYYTLLKEILKKMKKINLEEKTINDIISLINMDVQIFWNDFDYMIIKDNMILNIHPIEDVWVESYQNCDEAIIIETTKITNYKRMDEYKNINNGIITSIYSAKTLLYFTKAKRISEEEKELNLKKNGFTFTGEYTEIVKNPDNIFNYDSFPCNLVDVGFLLEINNKAVPLFSFENGFRMYKYENKYIDDFLKENITKYKFEKIY